MHELLAAVERAATPRTAQAADWAFFEHLVAMTDNQVLALLAGAVGSVYRVHHGFFERIYEGFVPDHHRVAAQAIEDGDGAAAAAAMQAFAQTATLVLAAAQDQGGS